MDFSHIPVLLNETIDSIKIKPDGVYVDGTLGGGGHSNKILTFLRKGRLIGIDQDEEAIKASKKRLEKFNDKFVPVKDNFSNIRQILTKLNVDKIDAAVMDLGVSSYQLDNPERGFSYMTDAPLDMRMDSFGLKTAYDVLNEYSEDKLCEVITKYGEERWAKRIAKFILENRSVSPIKTTGQLVEIIKKAIPKGARLEGGHPAKRTFQAIRIEVNSELSILETAIRDFAEVLSKNGRLAIITFHSLEDRIVKNTFNELARGCICPKDFPVCVCGKKQLAKVITKKPILPSESEINKNSRAKSAKLRVLEKIK